MKIHDEKCSGYQVVLRTGGVNFFCDPMFRRRWKIVPLFYFLLPSPPPVPHMDERGSSMIVVWSGSVVLGGRVSARLYSVQIVMWERSTSEGGRKEERKEKQEKNLTLPLIINTGFLKCFPRHFSGLPGYQNIFHHLLSPYSCFLFVGLPHLCSSSQSFTSNTLPNVRPI